MTRRRFWTVTALLACSLLLAAWTVFLLRLGLDRADKASSVASAVLTFVFGVAGVWLALASRPQPSPPEPSGQAQINTAKDQGRVYGVQHGNMIIGDAFRPPDGR
ncbi:hypothetical protein Aca07nite_65750 [Actinoplanes capillaceus]|uniref:Uncharacterized protein n=1 Tax=Actinoplanes campanulatus TaxID=113559 RepID=A0ABQ3WSN1_9ACTN|nr:hypothetical protein [Actinoplanes capillaceus]GID49300.1 hypothetical protein Aca07nite_65750 [Actinoplanes capillaceus]